MNEKHLKEKFFKDAIFRDFFWFSQNQADSEHTIWDVLAKQNPIHAAIAANDEAGEKRKTLPTIKFLMNYISEGNLLDIGCGYGRIAKYLIPRRRISTYFGLDSSRVMLKIFNDYHKSFPENLRKRLVLIKSPIEDIPLKDCVIDNAISVAVFLHNPKYITQMAIKEIYRTLKPGGTFIVAQSLPNNQTLAGFQGTLYLKILKIIGQGDKNGPIRYFSKQEVEQLFSDFKEVKIIYRQFSLIPKSILVFPKSLNNIWKRLVADPINNFFRQLIIRDRKAYPFVRYFDVILQK